MPSPFPGMNPYLEHPHFWADFHATYLTFLRSALMQTIGLNYYVAIEEHIYIHESDDDRKLIGMPDIDITFTASPNEVTPSGGTATLPAPATVTIPKLRKRKIGYLEVVDGENQKVITVIELLSPSNKYAGEDRESYLTKRRELFATRVNLVELDFLRGGPRLPLRDLPACSYYAMVSRPLARPKADIWPIKLREVLPSIPIPLSPGEPEPLVDLQAVLNRTYDESGSGRRIYRHEPEPRLAPTDAEWAKEILAAAPKA
jgi:hypothetical protein